jgi:type IV secretion system protein TrbI
MDPQALVLRGRPGRVVRFRRGVIVAVAALGSTALIGVAWMALRPAALQIIAGADPAPDVAGKAPDDALAGAPRSYGDVPKLGPPLPGDLGRPILRQQQQGIEALPQQTGRDTEADQAQAERQRVAAERKSARESAVLVQISSTARPSEVAAPAPGSPGVAQEAANKIPMAPEGDPGEQRRRADFVNARDGESEINPHQLMAPAPYTLGAGTIIAASLITGLNSDLPGLVTAQVTENTYDSATGRFLLVPQGSRLIGRYDNVIALGQTRALVAWQRIILPDGSSVRIDNMPATDSAGYAGLADAVAIHGWQLLKGVALSTLLGVGSELSFGGDEGDLIRALRASAQQSGSRAGDQLVAKNLAIPPTVTVRPGWPLRVLVHKDIVLAPYPSKIR